MTAGADDDLTSGRVYRPMGYARHALAGLVNMDTAPAEGKRISQCKGKPIRALIQAETQVIRWTDDEDVDPDADTGFIIPVGSTLEYDGDLARIRLFPGVAGAIAHISFYGI